MVVAKKFILVKHFDGEPKLSDFKLETEELKPLQDGEVLAELEWLSVDPYMRAYMSRYPVGTQMIGGQIAKILESKNKDYPVGVYIFGQCGWRTHTVFNPEREQSKNPLFSYVLPPFGNLTRSLGLGYLGMPGNTAYFGFLEICQPKEGEVVAVTGAAGAIGSLVGQIAKIKGCTVIGFTGDDTKVEYLKEIGFDYGINYKTADIEGAIKAVAPNGIDCYFDNVGGELSVTIIKNMSERGRISVCGAISTYNLPLDKQPKIPILQPYFVSKELLLKGFSIHSWADRWLDGIDANKKWIESGDVKYTETITNGFENTPQAFIDMLRGKNTGKAVVKA